LGGQLLGSLIVRTTNNSLPLASAKETRLLEAEDVLDKDDESNFSDMGDNEGDTGVISGLDVAFIDNDAFSSIKVSSPPPPEPH
jgi:hypothetical protein